MSTDEPVYVKLRRPTTSVPWGFRLQGGREFGTCLYIQKVNPRSVSERSGLRPGDGILRIGNTTALHINHEQAKMEIIRAGNELDFIVQRNAVDMGQSKTFVAPPPSRVEEEPSEYKGYTNPNVQSRSFKILQASLNYSEAGKENINMGGCDYTDGGSGDPHPVGTAVAQTSHPPQPLKTRTHQQYTPTSPDTSYQPPPLKIRTPQQYTATSSQHQYQPYVQSPQQAYKAYPQTSTVCQQTLNEPGVSYLQTSGQSQNRHTTKRSLSLYDAPAPVTQLHAPSQRSISPYNAPGQRSLSPYNESAEHILTVLRERSTSPYNVPSPQTATSQEVHTRRSRSPYNQPSQPQSTAYSGPEQQSRTYFETAPENMSSYEPRQQSTSMYSHTQQTPDSPKPVGRAVAEIRPGTVVKSSTQTSRAASYAAETQPHLAGYSAVSPSYEQPKTFPSYSVVSEPQEPQKQFPSYSRPQVHVSKPHFIPTTESSRHMIGHVPPSRPVPQTYQPAPAAPKPAPKSPQPAYQPVYQPVTPVIQPQPVYQPVTRIIHKGPKPEYQPTVTVKATVQPEQPPYQPYVAPTPAADQPIQTLYGSYIMKSQPVRPVDMTASERPSYLPYDFNKPAKQMSYPKRVKPVKPPELEPDENIRIVVNQTISSKKPVLPPVAKETVTVVTHVAPPQPAGKSMAQTPAHKPPQPAEKPMAPTPSPKPPQPAEKPQEPPPAPKPSKPAAETTAMKIVEQATIEALKTVQAEKHEQEKAEKQVSEEEPNEIEGKAGVSEEVSPPGPSKEEKVAKATVEVPEIQTVEVESAAEVKLETATIKVAETQNLEPNEIEGKAGVSEEVSPPGPSKEEKVATATVKVPEMQTVEVESADEVKLETATIKVAETQNVEDTETVKEADTTQAVVDASKTETTKNDDQEAEATIQLTAVETTTQDDDEAEATIKTSESEVLENEDTEAEAMLTLPKSEEHKADETEAEAVIDLSSTEEPQKDEAETEAVIQAPEVSTEEENTEATIQIPDTDGPKLEETETEAMIKLSETEDHGTDETEIETTISLSEATHETDVTETEASNADKRLAPEQNEPQSDDISESQNESQPETDQKQVESKETSETKDTLETKDTPEAKCTTEGKDTPITEDTPDTSDPSANPETQETQTHDTPEIHDTPARKDTAEPTETEPPKPASKE